MRTYKCIFYLVVIAASLAEMASCKKNNATTHYATDKTSLQAAIDSLTTVYNNATEGSKPGDYAIGAKEALDTALSLAGQVISTPTFTQQEVSNALNNLLQAAQQFNTKLLQEVSVANLVAFWKFNGNTIDSSGNGHDGTLKTGWIGNSVATMTDGGTLPQLTADRFGRADMAYVFNNGSLVQVPYAKALNPSSLTLSLWVKMTANTNGAYMLSLNRWWGYKFNLNGTNVPFFTVSVATTIYDRDAGAINVAAVWTHLAVTFTSGTEKFYVNGNLVNTWNNVPGSALTLSSPVDLSIGNEMPKEFYNTTDSNAPNYFYGANYWIGALDDIRLYNTALTDKDIQSIYTIESTLN